MARIALHGDPSTLDPHLQSEVIAQAVLGNIYETLVAFGPDMALVPQLAETWDNPSDLQWRFRLREGLRFHDGRPLRMEDVLASIERVRRHPRSRQAGSLVAVVDVRRLDDRTLELVTDRPYPVLLNRLAFVSIVPSDAPDEITAPVGTGPYRFEARSPGRVDLTAVADHWRVRSAPARAEYHFIADADIRVRGLLDGAFDLIDDVPPEHAESLDADPSMRLMTAPSLAVAYLQLAATVPPFDDPRVRRAVDMAIDRPAMVRELHGQFGVPSGQMVSRNVFGYDPTLQPTVRDLETARGLLADAGFADGLELTLELRDGREDGPVLARQLAEIGVKLRVVERPWGDMYAQLSERRVPFYLGAWVNTSGDAGDVLDRKLHSRQPERGYGDANYGDFSHPELDAIIEESNAVLSLERRQELLQRALGLSRNDLAYIPLYSRRDVYAVRSDLSWTPRQDARTYAYELAADTGRKGGR
ncbi:MAG: ABC transporter substrate-binding protein [Acidobacteriota bacterium]